MNSSPWARRLLSLLALPLVSAGVCTACTGTDEPPPTGELPDPICTEGTSWRPGTTAFREATSEFQLDALGVEGTRLSAVDLDNDGYPDLVVRRGGLLRDEDAARSTWVLKNEGGKRFVDVTASSGLLATREAADGKGRPGEVWAFGDVDNDGYLDVYTGVYTQDLTKTAGERSEVLLNNGDFTFRLAALDNAVRRPGEVDMPAGASFTDFDRDGVLDLFVSQHNTDDFVLQRDRLYRGLGDGRFVEVGGDIGLATEDWVSLEPLNEGRAHSRAWGAAACDLNGDGLPELLTPSYGRAPNHLWLAKDLGGEVAYVNRSLRSGYAYDENFSWEDNQFARCFCQQNPSAEGCASVPAPQVNCSQPNWNHSNDREPFRLGGNSGTTVCGDVDNDGDLDLLTTEIKHWWAGAGSDGSEILLNDGASDPRFDRPGRESMGLEIPHLGASWDEGHMTAALFDFDNDGWLDVYIGASDYPGNRGLLFRNATGDEGELWFEPVDIADGIDHTRSHGIAVADFDGDGDLDVVVGHSRARCDSGGDCYPTMQVRLFENVLGDKGNFLQLSLVGGEGSNRAAIGARVTVKAGGVTQTREIGGGHGHYGMQNDLLVHVGLGSACEAEVTVRWPDAKKSTQTFTLPAGHRFRVTQGKKPELVAR